MPSDTTLHFGSGFTVNATDLGMDPSPSPAVAAQSDGTFRVVFEANNDLLAGYSSGGTRHLDDGQPSEVDTRFAGGALGTGRRRSSERMRQVSIVFQIDQDHDPLWFPASDTARMYKAMVEALASHEKLASGLSEEWQDQFDIDLPVFEQFIGHLIQRFGHAETFVLRGLVIDLASIGSVMIERAGGTLPTLSVEDQATWAHRRQAYGGAMAI